MYTKCPEVGSPLARIHRNELASWARMRAIRACAHLAPHPICFVRSVDPGLGWTGEVLEALQLVHPIELQAPPLKGFQEAKDVFNPGQVHALFSGQKLNCLDPPNILL